MSRKVNPGDPLRVYADEVNAWNDAADAHKAGSFTGARPSKATPLGPGEVLVYNGTTQPMETGTGAVIVGPRTAPPSPAEFAAVSLSSMVPAAPISGAASDQLAKLGTLNEFLGSKLLEVRAPVSNLGGGGFAYERFGSHWVTLKEPLPVSGVGVGVIEGIAPVRARLSSLNDTHLDLTVSGPVPEGRQVGAGMPIVWAKGWEAVSGSNVAFRRQAAVSGEQWVLAQMGRPSTGQTIAAAPLAYTDTKIKDITVSHNAIFNVISGGAPRTIWCRTENWMAPGTVLEFTCHVGTPVLNGGGADLLTLSCVFQINGGSITARYVGETAGGATGVILRPHVFKAVVVVQQSAVSGSRLAYRGYAEARTVTKQRIGGADYTFSDLEYLDVAQDQTAAVAQELMSVGVGVSPFGTIVAGTRYTTVSVPVLNFSVKAFPPQQYIYPESAVSW